MWHLDLDHQQFWCTQWTKPSVCLLAVFYNPSFELTVHLLAIIHPCPSLEAVSPCLRMDHSLNLHARFVLQLFFLRVPSNKSRSGQINKSSPPPAVDPAEIWHIIGTILRRTNQNQSQKKRGCFHLLMMAADRLFEFVSLSLGGKKFHTGEWQPLNP